MRVTAFHLQSKSGKVAELLNHAETKADYGVVSFAGGCNGG